MKKDMVSANIVVVMNLILNDLFYITVTTTSRSPKNLTSSPFQLVKGGSCPAIILEVSIEYLQ
jgi:hypothetical protein